MPATAGQVVTINSNYGYGDAAFQQLREITNYYVIAVTPNTATPGVMPYRGTQVNTLAMALGGAPDAESAEPGAPVFNIEDSFCTVVVPPP